MPAPAPVRRRTPLRPLPGLLLTAALAACATLPTPESSGPDERDGEIITRAQITKTQAVNGWEALQRSATHLRIQYPMRGRASVSHRGVNSFYLSSEMLLIVDGTQMRSVTNLRQIPANSIEYMQIMPARVAMVKYGMPGGNGVVYVRTSPAARTARNR